jgi:hypothetical protein
MSAVSQFLSPRVCCIDSSCALGSRVYIPLVGPAPLICKAGGTAWIVSPATAAVTRVWGCRDDASTYAQNVTGSSGWFVPTSGQLYNPGYVCRTYWDSYSTSCYWSSSELNLTYASAVDFGNLGNLNTLLKGTALPVRALRAVTY